MESFKNRQIQQHKKSFQSTKHMTVLTFERNVIRLRLDLTKQHGWQCMKFCLHSIKNE